MRRLERRNLVWLLAAGLALNLLLPRFPELRQSVHAVRSMQWEWLLLAALCAACTEPAAALSLTGAVERPLAFQHTVLVQMASTFWGRVTPKGIGGVALLEHYLERSGIERPMAVAAIATTMLASMLVHMPSLLLASLLMGAPEALRLRLPALWPAVVLPLAALPAGAALCMRSAAIQRRLDALRHALHDVWRLLRHPKQAAKLFLGAALVIASKTLTLAICLKAFGAELSLWSVATLYLGGAAVSNASPAPGGLGALEAALVVGLSALGMQPGAALAGVLAFRLLTFWLPMAPAALISHWLQRRMVI